MFPVNPTNDLLMQSYISVELQKHDDTRPIMLYNWSLPRNSQLQDYQASFSLKYMHVINHSQRWTIKNWILGTIVKHSLWHERWWGCHSSLNTFSSATPYGSYRREYLSYHLKYNWRRKLVVTLIYLILICSFKVLPVSLGTIKRQLKWHTIQKTLDCIPLGLVCKPTHHSSWRDSLSSHCQILYCPAAGAYCSHSACSENPAHYHTHNLIHCHVSLYSTNMNFHNIKTLFRITILRIKTCTVASKHLRVFWRNCRKYWDMFKRLIKFQKLETCTSTVPIVASCYLHIWNILEMFFNNTVHRFCTSVPT